MKPDQTKNIPPPFCCDCKHFIPEPPPKSDGIQTDAARCGLSEMIEVVHGKKFFPPCIEMRANGSPCGMEAKYFQSKSVVEVDRN